MPLSGQVNNLLSACRPVVIWTMEMSSFGSLIQIRFPGVRKTRNLECEAGLD